MSSKSPPGGDKQRPNDIIDGPKDPNDETAVAAGLDPFGLNYDDGLHGVGPEQDWPPVYERDAMTGQMTGRTTDGGSSAASGENSASSQVLTSAEKRFLQSDVIEKQDHFERKMVEHFDSNPDTFEAISNLGQRVRESTMALNVLGRSVPAQQSRELLDPDDKEIDLTKGTAPDDHTMGTDAAGFTQHLTPNEFATFQAYMKKKYKLPPITPDDIPVQHRLAPNPRSRSGEGVLENPDQTSLALQWMSARALRQMSDDSAAADDDYYAHDLVPYQLTPSKLVNRRQAQPIPPTLLKYNNVALLSRFLTPVGKIQNRVLTKLGAKNQRRVAHYIKRCRALGLLPYTGQIKIEQHGHIHDPKLLLANHVSNPPPPDAAVGKTSPSNGRKQLPQRLVTINDILLQLPSAKDKKKARSSDDSSLSTEDSSTAAVADPVDVEDIISQLPLHNKPWEVELQRRGLVIKRRHRA
jgi:ribosomal protein S18